MALLDFSLPASDPNNPNGVTSASDLQRRLLAAQLMQKNGSDTSPIQSPWQGAARMVQAALGGWDEGQLNKQAAAGAKANSDALAAALGGMGGAAAPAAGGGSVTATPAAATIPGASAPVASGGFSGPASIAPYAASIAKVESAGSGDYSAQGPVLDSGDRAYGKYQVMGANIPQWTKAALGQSLTPAQFLASPQAQDAVFAQQFGNSLQKYGNPQDAASVWFTGKPLAQAGANVSDGYSTNGQYQDKFSRALAQQLAMTGGQPSAAPVAASTQAPAQAPPQVASLGSLSGIGGGAALPATTPLPPPRPANLGAAPAPTQVASNDSEDDATPIAGGQVAALPPSAAPQPQAVPTAPARPAIDTQKLLAVISSPYSTPAQQQIATALLQSAMKQDQYSAPYKDQFGNVVQRAANGELKVINAAEKPESDLWQATPDGMMYNKKTGEIKQGTSGGKPFLMGEDHYGGKIYGTMKNGVPTPLQQQPDQGAASAPANPNLHGEEFLQTLDPGMAGQVRSIIEGRTPYPTGMLLKTPYGERLSTYVTQADPTFEAGNATARVAARKEFLSGGPSSPAGVITAGNTALQHLGDLSDAAEQLGNYNTTIPGNNLLNAGKNALMAGDNAVPLARFNNTVAKYVDEATKFYRGAGGTEADIQRDIKNLSPNMSPSELRAAIDQSATLMQGKINALQDRWRKAMGPMVPDIPIVQPESQAALSRIQQRAQPGGPAAGGDPLSQARAAIAAGAPRGAVIQRLQQHGIDPSGL